MKELLYLKDTQLKQLIEKLFTSYRESFSDAKKILDKYSIGIAHHKVLHLVSTYKGITISELLKKLKVTKQSLNRVLKDLNDKGERIFEEVFLTQKKRIYNALLNSSSEQVLNFDNVLKKIINE